MCARVRLEEAIKVRVAEVAAWRDGRESDILVIECTHHPRAVACTTNIYRQKSAAVALTGRCMQANRLI